MLSCFLVTVVTALERQTCHLLCCVVFFFFVVQKDDGDESGKLIDIPANDVVKFVLERLMALEEIRRLLPTTAAAAAPDGEDGEDSAAIAVESFSSIKEAKEDAEGEEEAEKDEDTPEKVSNSLQSYFEIQYTNTRFLFVFFQCCCISFLFLGWGCRVDFPILLA